MNYSFDEISKQRPASSDSAAILNLRVNNESNWMLETAISLLKAHAIFDYPLVDRVKCLNDINLGVAFNWKLFIP